MNHQHATPAAINGFTSVMMDGSLEADAKTPASYEYNVAVTKKVVDFAHSVGVSVEGELGCLGSLETGKGEAEDGHGFGEELSTDMLLTDPEEAADFVAKTKVDALAIAIGTSHGAYKFTRKPTGEVLAISRPLKFINASKYSSSNADQALFHKNGYKTLSINMVVKFLRHTVYLLKEFRKESEME